MGSSLSNGREVAQQRARQENPWLDKEKNDTGHVPTRFEIRYFLKLFLFVEYFGEQCGKNKARMIDPLRII